MHHFVISMKLFYVVVILVCFIEQSSVEAFPPVNFHKLYGLVAANRVKKSDISIFDPNEDVLELEHLKQKPIHIQGDKFSRIEEELPAEQDKKLITLQGQLETQTTNKVPNIGQPEKEENYRSFSLTPETIHDKQNQEPTTAKSLLKSFHGAARLAFGQKPEVLTTLSTTLQLDDSLAHNTTEKLSIENNISSTIESNAENPEEIEKTNNGERRSIGLQPKIFASLLKHNDGQFSAFDMAQYIFWTGDESGVAHSIEELVHENLLSREDALQFLKDIRIGIEFLRSSYTNHIFPDIFKEHVNTKSNTPQTPMESEVTTLLPPKIPSHIQKLLEDVPSMLKVGNEENNKNTLDNAFEYDDSAGRTRITEFLYAEYSLEEVIYQLAKVMFSQSLNHGSAKAQDALQRLINFLHTEGENGKISPALQKKILDVLLSALSDTLAEHPKLLAAAKAELGKSIPTVPKYKTILKKQ